MSGVDAVVPEGQRLISAWERATADLALARRRLAEAERDQAEAERSLGRWILPPDAEPYEKIGVWNGKLLYVATLSGDRETILVNIRRRAAS